jgi:UTP-glucose-1-phosphate uridylyltransferase
MNLSIQVLAVEKVEKKFLHKYGIIKGSKINKRDWELSGISRKTR